MYLALTGKMTRILVIKVFKHINHVNMMEMSIPKYVILQ